MYLLDNFLVLGGLNSRIIESIMIFAEHAISKPIKKVKDPMC